MRLTTVLPGVPCASGATGVGAAGTGLSGTDAAAVVAVRASDATASSAAAVILLEFAHAGDGTLTPSLATAGTA